VVWLGGWLYPCLQFVITLSANFWLTSINEIENKWQESVIDGFELLTAITMKSVVFWVVMPYSSERCRRFGRPYRFHLHGRIVRQRKHLVSAGFFLGLLFDPERAIFFSETSGFLRTTLRYILQVRIHRMSYCFWNWAVIAERLINYPKGNPIVINIVPSGRVADHSSPCFTEVKNAWSYTSTPPHFFMAWCLNN
jgi:hypothetical protein